jgi:hypothetical protein
VISLELHVTWDQLLELVFPPFGFEHPSGQATTFVGASEFGWVQFHGNVDVAVWSVIAAHSASEYEGTLY